MKEFISKILGFDKYEFNSVKISSDVIRDICEMASNAYPNEFFAYLQGEIIDKNLTINGLFVQPYEAGTNSAVYHISDMPMSAKTVGTVHSHPSRGGPSRADIKSFLQTGLVHIIIDKPYNKDAIHCYNMKGKEIHFDVFH